MQIFGWLGAVCLVGWLARLFYKVRPRRAHEIGFKYVYVQHDGDARELNTQERLYLKTEFCGGDGGRPYIKSNYDELTPDGQKSGYLLRRQLPKHIAVHLTTN